MRIITIVVLILLATLVFSVPSSISFQGVLKDSTGSPVTGSRTITFDIFPSASGAGSLWTETQTISVEAGLYNVKLGSVTPITASVFDGNTKYLGMSIGGGELLPRTALESMPYSFRAERSDYSDYAAIAGSSGGIPNAVLFNPTTIQSTSAANAVWVRSSSSGTDQARTSAVSAETSGSYSFALTGWASDPSGAKNCGVGGVSSGVNGFGILGMATGAQGIGINGMGTGVAGIGVYGKADSSTGNNYGGYFQANGDQGIGVYGKGVTVGGSFEATNINGTGVYAKGPYHGISAYSTATGGGGGAAVYANNNGDDYGLDAHSTDGIAIHGKTWITGSYAAHFEGGRGIIIPNTNGAVSSPGTSEGTIRYYNNHFYGWTGAGGGLGWKQLDN